MERYCKLLDTICAIQQQSPPGNLIEVIESAPPVGESPLPWDTWTFFSFVRHESRLRWAKEVYVSSLRARFPGQRRPNPPEHGTVPEHPDWEYTLGDDFCLTHKTEGTKIEACVLGGEAFVTLFGYREYLESLRQPKIPERRVLELHPDIPSVGFSMDQLIKAEVLSPGILGYSLLLPEEKSERRAIRHFCHAWSRSPDRIWLAASIGDWLAAHDAALCTKDASLIELTQTRADECRRQRLEEAAAEVSRDSKNVGALCAYADLGGKDLDEHLIQYLTELIAELHPTEVATLGGDDVEEKTQGVAELHGESHARFVAELHARMVAVDIKLVMKMVENRCDESWCPRIFKLLEDLDLGPQSLEMTPLLECVRFLAKHDYRRAETLQKLASVDGPLVGDALLLAFEHGPNIAMPIIRRGLRSSNDTARTATAAILAEIDLPWTRRELLDALQDSTDDEKTRECRSALVESRDPACRLAVEEWERRNLPPRTDGLVTSCRLEFHDRVMTLRSRLQESSGY